MQIAVLGAGAIGSSFAFHLALAGHAVTVIARGARLEMLQRDQAITLVSGESAAVRVSAALDAEAPYDLVLVTVLAPQVDAVMPALEASAAKKVMFMFNTFEPLDRLRESVGADRYAFGFPQGVFTLMIEGRLKKQVRGGTTTDDATWARVFTEAGIPTVVEADMHSWLRSHAALVIPLMSIGTRVVERRAGITWGEAGQFAEAMNIGFRIVRELGSAVTPALLDRVSRLPMFIVTALLWALSRTAMLRDLGLLGPTEARMLIDMMTAAAPARSAALLAIRP